MSLRLRQEVQEVSWCVKMKKLGTRTAVRLIVSRAPDQLGRSDRQSGVVTRFAWRRVCWYAAVCHLFSEGFATVRIAKCQ